jgi:ABC-2 type transport system ATP-binding protein
VAVVTTGNQVALSLSGLSKRFRNNVAVDDVAFEVRPGEVVGLIGPNGAGKSTTMKIITGQLLADQGQVLIDGSDVREESRIARLKTGYVPQEIHLYPFLTGREHMEFVAGVKGLDAQGATALIDQELERFGLHEAQHRMAREYSEGMARKLSIALALLGDPALLVLDESLTGLDPRAAAEVKATINSQRERGTAILLVSHMLEVLERICTRVLVMDRGKLVAELQQSELHQLLASGTTLEEFFLEHTV